MKQNRITNVQDLGVSPHSGKPLVMGSTVFNEDCMNVMARYPDKFFDLAIVDPPYGIGVGIFKPVGGRGEENRDNKQWDISIPDANYFKELERVSKEQIIWGANYFNCFNGNGGAIIWDKLQPLPDSSQCEIASYSRVKKVYKYTQRWTNFVNTKETEHPTEKPVRLYDWLLKEFAKDGFKILDTHCGSGASRISCNKAGLEYVGCEIDKDYFEAQEARFKEFTSQLRLFG